MKILAIGYILTTKQCNEEINPILYSNVFMVVFSPYYQHKRQFEEKRVMEKWYHLDRTNFGVAPGDQTHLLLVRRKR